MMANFPILQEIKGEWRSAKTMEIMGLRIPAYFTDDPRLLYDYIVNHEEPQAVKFLSRNLIS